jgi:F0F1-type ATP synthase delta subunit
MYTKDYTQATYEVIREGADPEKTLASLLRYLEKRGLSKLYPSILRGLGERMRRAEKSSVPRVVLARESDFKKNKEHIEHLLTDITETKDHTIHIDESIIGGFILENRNKRIDHSYKKELLQAYRRLTAEDTL